MDVTRLQAYILEKYGVGPEYPWAQYPNYFVFRHSQTKKWFALVMDLPKEKLGLPGSGTINVLNVKCEPLMIGSLRSEPGIYPAYHMSKTSWITVALDGRVKEEEIQFLLDLSYHLTEPKKKKKAAPESVSQ